MKTFALIAVVLAGFAAADESPDAAAIRVLDDFMTAFNARDAEALAETLNYPHVRIAGGAVELDETPEEFIDEMDFDAFAKRFNWDHSAWGERTIVQSDSEKVHVALEFTRYDPDGNVIAVYKSLYIVTRLDGHWGVQARSSFAP